jgi:hypothetical protein
MAAIELEFKWALDVLQPGQRLPFANGAQSAWVERLGTGFAAFTETAVEPLQLRELLKLFSAAPQERRQVLLWRDRVLACQLFTQLDITCLEDFILRYSASSLSRIAADQAGSPASVRS